MSYVRKTLDEMESDSYDRAVQQDIRVEQINGDTCIAENIDNGTMYNITLFQNYVVECDCPHHRYRNVICKHMAATNLQLGYPISRRIL